MSGMPVRYRPRLTPRHIEVLRLAGQGKTNGEISRLLFLAPDTVKTHMRRAFRALGATTRTEAVLKLHQLGLLDPAHEPIFAGAERRASTGRRRGDARRTHPGPSRP